MLNAKEIKDWLKTIGKNREWLAEKTLVSKRFVDGWLSSGNLIPAQKLALIEKLVSGEDEIEFELPPNFEQQLRAMADEMHKNIEDMVSFILRSTVGVQTKKQSTSVSAIDMSRLNYTAPVIGKYCRWLYPTR